MPEYLLHRGLVYFARVAEAGNKTTAARELGVSQPSLSVAMKNLEEELGTTLLIRSRQGVRLTSTGEVLLQHARQAVHLLGHARDEIHGLESEPRGRFTLGCHASLGGYFLPGFMASFLRRHPGIELQLWNGNSRDVERAVLEREIDLGLVVNPEAHPDSVSTPLFQDRVAFVVTAALARRAAGGAQKLLETHPLLHVPALQQSQFLLAWLRKEEVPVRPLGSSSLELVKSLVLDGVGVGILPMRVAAHGVSAGRLRPVSKSLPYFDDRIALVRRVDTHQTKAFRLLTEAIREHGKGMPDLSAVG